MGPATLGTWRALSCCNCRDADRETWCTSTLRMDRWGLDGPSLRKDLA